MVARHSLRVARPRQPEKPDEISSQLVCPPSSRAFYHTRPQNTLGNLQFPIAPTPVKPVVGRDASPRRPRRPNSGAGVPPVLSHRPPRLARLRRVSRRPVNCRASAPLAVVIARDALRHVRPALVGTTSRSRLPRRQLNRRPARVVLSPSQNLRQTGHTRHVYHPPYSPPLSHLPHPPPPSEISDSRSPIVLPAASESQNGPWSPPL